MVTKLIQDDREVIETRVDMQAESKILASLTEKEKEIIFSSFHWWDKRYYSSLDTKDTSVRNLRWKLRNTPFVKEMERGNRW